jgi:hypothetical protein
MGTRRMGGIQAAARAQCSVWRVTSEGREREREIARKMGVRVCV